MFPTFSRMRGDTGEMKKVYLNIIQGIGMLSLLFNLGLFCVADNLLVSVLGKGTGKWLPSLDVLRILCIYGIVRSLIEPAASLLMANGKVNIPFKANLLVAVAELAFVYPAIKYGSIEVVGLVVLLAYAGQAVIYLPALRQFCDISFREILLEIWPAVAAGLVMCFGYLCAKRFISINLTSLVFSAVSMTLLYAIVYGLITDFKMYRKLNAMLVSK